MAYLSKLGQLKMGVEPTRDTAPVAMTYVDTKEPVSTGNLVQESIANDDWKVHLEEEAPYIGAKSGSTVTVNKHLATRTASSAIPTAGPTAATAATLFGELPDAVLVGQALGGLKIFGDGTATSFTSWTAYTALTRTMTVADSSEYTVGEYIAVQTSSSAPGLADLKWEVARIAEVPDGTSLVLASPLSQIYPADVNDKVYAGVTAYTCDAYQIGTLQATIQGQAAADLYTCKGMRAKSLKLTANPLEMGSLSVEYAVHDWTRATGSVPVYAARVAGDRRQVLAGKCTAYDGTTNLSLDVSKIEADAGIEHVTTKSVSDTQGTNDAVLLAHNARLNIDPTFADESLFTAFSASTKYEVVAWWGGQPGKIWGIGMSAGCVEKSPNLQDKEGVKAHGLTLMATRHADNANAWSDAVPENKSFYIFCI